MGLISLWCFDWKSRSLFRSEKNGKQKAGCEGTLTGYKTVSGKQCNKAPFNSHEKLIRELEAKINNGKQLRKMYELKTSIKGGRQQTALFIIACTNGFTQFESWRKFECYPGNTTFPDKSGISIKGIKKVSHLV